MDLALCISLTPESRSHLDDEDLAELDSHALKDAVVAALRRLGPVRVWDTTTLSPAALAAERRPDLILNLAEGLYGTGREAQAPALFEWLQWPYVGSDPVTLALTHDKWFTHCVLERAGVPTPRALRLDRPIGPDFPLDLPFPLIAKPVAEGAGKGIHDSNVVDDRAALAALVESALQRHRQPLVVEEFLPGRELTAAVIGNRGSWEVLPIVEIDFAAIPQSPRRVYGYEAKFTWHGQGHMVGPARLDEPLRRRIGLPVVNKEHKTLTFHAWYPGCPMEEDAYGIPKPKDTEVIVPTLLFVPCVGYGPGGFRLGYGGGFYDRTLASLQPRPFTVGLGYTHGYLDDLEPEAHDQPLDAILNDNGVVWPI